MDPSSRVLTETQLLNRQLGFSGTYMAVNYLRSLAESAPDSLTENTFTALMAAARDFRFESKKQALFLFREIFETLVHMAVNRCIPAASRIIPDLQEMLMAAKGKRRRALALALGCLPVRLENRPEPAACNDNPVPIGFERLLAFLGGRKASPYRPTWKGRSLILAFPDNAVATLKFAVSRTNIRELSGEACWLDYLRRHPPLVSEPFHLPCPVCVNGHVLFKIQGMPRHLAPEQSGLLDFPAIAFKTTADYYRYPNTGTAAVTFPPKTVKQIFCKSAKILGRLLSMGLAHTALIPLFHNRTQQGRRNDNGAYLWEHGGRLDQWLDSCRYPNFALSGPRDFEHLVQVTDSRQLGHFIGEHILSFVLVIGSYFRSRVPPAMGNQRSGKPLDTRPYFDAPLFTDILTGVTAAYCQGLNREKPPEMHRFKLPELVGQLIDKMGLDEDMEEVLRIRDQLDMSPQAFVAYLKDRGIKNPDGFTKGERDISLTTGPHLGGFNQPISVPGLIEFLFCFSAFCLSRRYLTENR